MKTLTNKITENENRPHCSKDNANSTYSDDDPHGKRKRAVVSENPSGKRPAKKQRTISLNGEESSADEETLSIEASGSEISENESVLGGILKAGSNQNDEDISEDDIVKSTVTESQLEDEVKSYTHNFK